MAKTITQKLERKLRKIRKQIVKAEVKVQRLVVKEGRVLSLLKGPEQEVKKTVRKRAKKST